MYYYFFSRVLHWDEHAQLNDPNYPHAKKNILIFMFGSIAYLFTAGFLWSKQYTSLINGTLFLSIIKDFFLWFIAIDVIVCFILFKQFWGRGLLTELDGTFENKKRMSANSHIISLPQKVETLSDQHTTSNKDVTIIQQK
jgi:hypothetical protein